MGEGSRRIRVETISSCAVKYWGCPKGCQGSLSGPPASGPSPQRPPWVLWVRQFDRYLNICVANATNIVGELQQRRLQGPRVRTSVPSACAAPREKNSLGQPHNPFASSWRRVGTHRNASAREGGAVRTRVRPGRGESPRHPTVGRWSDPRPVPARLRGAIRGPQRCGNGSPVVRGQPPEPSAPDVRRRHLVWMASGTPVSARWRSVDQQWRTSRSPMRWSPTASASVRS